MITVLVVDGFETRTVLTPVLNVESVEYCTSSPELEAELSKSLDGISDLTLDFSALEYISSAGLRVLLSSHKAMMSKGGMKIVHVNDVVQEVFEVTGFSDILTIE